MDPELLELLRQRLAAGTPADATRVAPRRGLSGPALEGPPQPVMSAAPVLRSNVEAAPGLGRAALEIGAAMVNPIADAALTGRDVARNLMEGEYAQAVGNTAMGVGGAMLAANPVMALGRGARRGLRWGEDMLRRAEGRIPVRSTQEMVPGIDTGNLLGLLQADDATRLDYTKASDWVNPATGRDLWFEAAQLPGVQTTARGTGVYRNSRGGIETNPLTIGRVMARPEDADAINTVERVRGLLDAQMASAGSAVMPDAAGGSVFLPLRRGLRPEEARSIIASAPPGAKNFADTGRGLTFFPFGGAAGDELTELVRGLSRNNPELRSMQPGAPQRTDFERLSWYNDIFEGGTGGAQAARRALMSGDQPAVSREVLEQVESYAPLMERIGQKPGVDEIFSRAGYGQTNRDIQRMRDDAAKAGGLQRLLERAAAGDVSLPAMALLTGGAGLSAYGQNEDVGEGLAGASLAGLLGVAARPVGEAWHGSPQHGINQFQRSREGMTGQGVYVARNDPLGAGQKQALGYATPGLGYVNVGGRAILPMDAKKIEEALGRNVGDETLLALDDALFMARKRMGPKDYPRGMGFADPSIFGRYRSTLRSHWLDALSEMTDRYKGRGMSPAQQGAQLVAAGDIDVNRPGMYRLWVDADNERMLNFDMGLNEQPEFVRNALLSSNDPRIAAAVKRAVQDSRAQSSMGTVADSPDFVPDGRMIFRRMESEIPDPQKLRETLEAMGLEGVQASGGSYPVRSALSASGTPDFAESTQYSIFNPERIRILEALAAAGILPAANALARMQEPQAAPPEG